MNGIKLRILGAVGVVGAVVWMQIASAAGDNVMNARTEAVDANGTLHVPSGYRDTYQFLGTWAVAKDEGSGSEELHSVYASPGVIAAYQKEGHFPDGAVLVKEVYRASTAGMTTGTVSRADALRGWFVMVRDTQGHHARKETWGDGWGWSWFDATDPLTPSRALPRKGGELSASDDYRMNCRPCHTPAQATDWIFTEGYPRLKR